jgi:hypothetical protein
VAWEERPDGDGRRRATPGGPDLTEPAAPLHARRQLRRHKVCCHLGLGSTMRPKRLNSARINRM